MRTLYQAQLFAPAFLFQTWLEAWGTLIEPRRTSEPTLQPLPSTQRIEPTEIVSQPMVLSAPITLAHEPVDAGELVYA